MGQAAARFFRCPEENVVARNLPVASTLEERALATCAQVLLTARDLAEIDEALLAIRGVCEASTVFVELNVDDPEAGPSTRLLREVTAEGRSFNVSTWHQMPWSRLPDTHDRLSRGETHVFLVDELGAVERATYEGSQTRSEVDVPFFAEGRWAGLIGMADFDRPREWAHSEIRFLEQAAELIGHFWERQLAEQAVRRTADIARRRARYEHAIAECSRALLAGRDDSAVDVALQALLTATDADHGFIEVNVDDPRLGLCSSTLHEVTKSGPRSPADDAYWALVPWSKMPDSHARLSAGKAFAFTIDDLGPVERAQYEGAPHSIGSEINLPIFVNGVWSGIVGFADKDEHRIWDGDERRLLGTAAEMIGTFWARKRDRERLTELVRSKDDFVAAVSHELRTPLTTVVGLAHELAERSDFSPTEEAGLLDMLASQADEVAHIVDDLLAAARLDMENLAVQVEPVRLEEEAAAVVMSLVAADDIPIKGEATALADAARVRQVVRNLLTNAGRYGGPNARIEVEVHDAVARVRVVDDGPGLPDGAHHKAFERYEALGRSATQPASVGLGLAISRDLARLMSGSLRYARQNGETVFELALPLAPPVPEPATGPG